MYIYLIYLNTTVAPVVEVETSLTEVVISHSVTLHCNVIRTNPEVIMYTWISSIQESSSIMLQSNNATITVTLLTEHYLGTVVCIATNAVGRIGNAGLMIELRCKCYLSCRPIEVLLSQTFYMYDHTS